MRGGILTGLKCHPQGQVLGFINPMLSLDLCGGPAVVERPSSVASEAFSCSYTHLTGIGVGGLKSSPAFQGHPQGLRGTAQTSTRGREREGGRGMQDAPWERKVGIRGDEKDIK